MAAALSAFRLPPPPPKLSPYNNSTTTQVCMVCILEGQSLHTSDQVIRKLAVGEERMMGKTLCCEQWVHRYKHQVLENGCYVSWCTARAPKVVTVEAAGPAVIKADNVAAGSGVKPTKPSEGDTKTAATVGMGSNSSAFATAAVGTGVNPVGSSEKDAKAAADSVGASAAALKEAAELKKTALENTLKELILTILTRALNPIREKGTDLMPLLKAYEMVSGVFKKDEKILLFFLLGQSLNTVEKANLQKAFEELKDLSKLNEAQLFAFYQVKEFLNPASQSSPPIAYAWLYVKYSAPKLAASAPQAQANPTETNATKQGVNLDAEAAVKELAKTISNEEMVKLAEEFYEGLLKDFAENKLNLKQLIAKYVARFDFYVAFNKAKESKVNFSILEEHVMLVQSSECLSKLGKTFNAEEFENENERNQMRSMRAVHTRIINFQRGLERLLNEFLKAPSEATFNKFIELSKRYEGVSKRYEFDCIAFLKPKFVWGNGATTMTLAKFFDSVAATHANQAWITAWKPIVDAAKKELVAELAIPTASTVTFAVQYA
jgi:hypothetical protein